MADRKYLNQDGLVTLIQKISELIKSHTSSTVDTTKPNNFITVGAVNTALTNRANLTIKLDSNTNTTDTSYTTAETTTTYNGTASVELNLKLATEEDINSLFN